MDEGAAVAALDLKHDEASRDRATIALECDVGDSASVASAVREARKVLGRLDIAVNNAGIGQAPNDGSTELYSAMERRSAELASQGKSEIIAEQLIHMEDEGWSAVMAVNLDGTFYTCREFARILAEDGSPGAIINISSTSAQSGEGSPHYCTSKAAVIGLTRQLARELAPRQIRVNAVAPGPTNTPIMQGIPADWISSMEASVPLGRLADPSEIASVVAFLASDDSSFVNGSVVVANGASYYF
jgi:3-oxoacyl-[acyl-carrier protein] reductase